MAAKTTPKAISPATTTTVGSTPAVRAIAIAAGKTARTKASQVAVRPSGSLPPSRPRMKRGANACTPP
ncbi:MAG TPA: hypothetical protein VMH33_09710 [Solirubrobacterales bacterium]|nr:hypothetical protein [Solirubrobacterales bacterium]